MPAGLPGAGEAAAGTTLAGPLLQQLTWGLAPLEPVPLQQNTEFIRAWLRQARPPDMATEVQCPQASHWSRVRACLEV